MMLDRQRVIQLRNEHYTMEAIAVHFRKAGIHTTRQRIHQILKDAGMSGVRYSTPRKEKLYPYRCEGCGETFFLKTYNTKRKFHNVQCMVAARNPYPEKNPHPVKSKAGYHWRYEMLKKYQPEKLRLYRIRKYERLQQRLKNPSYRKRYNRYHARWLREKKRKLNSDED